MDAYRLGFELALLLPWLMWGHRRRRQARHAFWLCIALVLGAAPSTALAVSILHFEDKTNGISVVPGALASLGLSGSTTFTDDTDVFTALLAAGDYDLVIFGEQANFIFYASLGMEDYVARGGRVLGATFVPDGRFAALMQVTSVGSNTASIIVEPHPIFSGLGTTIAVDGPWQVFSRDWGPNATAIGIGRSGQGAAAVLGNAGQTLMLAPLFDSYPVVSEGERLVANSVAFLLPEPSAGLLLALLLAGLGLGQLGKERQQ